MQDDWWPLVDCGDFVAAAPSQGKAGGNAPAAAAAGGEGAYPAWYIEKMKKDPKVSGRGEVCGG